MWAAIRHTYWDWVSMLMLMLLELMIYFVIVFRMLLPLFFHTRNGCPLIIETKFGIVLKDAMVVGSL